MPHGLECGYSTLDGDTAYGVGAWIVFFPAWGIVFSFPVSTCIDPFSQCSSLQFVNAVDAVLAIDPTWCSNPTWCGDSSSSTLMTSFFLSLPPSKTLLSFLLPLTQLSFFVVLLLCFDPCSHCSCITLVALSLSTLILSSCIMSWHTRRVLNSRRL